MLSIRQLEATLQAVITTAASAQTSESHAAAACDALRACLSACENSDHAELRAPAYTRKTWVDVFEIFLTTSESRKPKPLKLLLIALERNLIRNHSQSSKDDLTAYVSSKIWRIISTPSGGSAVKPALQALRHFLSKSVILSQDIISAVSRHYDSREPETVGSHVSSIGTGPSTSTSASQYRQHSLDFLCRVLYWARYPDTAPITGRLISAFCSTLHAWSSTWVEPATLEHARGYEQPIWLSATTSFLESYPDSIELLANHVFPEIVCHDRMGTGKFMERFLARGMMDCDRMKLEIQLLLLQAMLESGLYKTIDSRTIENIGGQLLHHSSPRIRSAAFSLIVHSSSPSAMLDTTVLLSLRSTIPYYHVEANPKLRQENFAMIKRLLFRVSSAVKSCNKTTPEQPAEMILPERTSPSVLPLHGQVQVKDSRRRQNREFFAWYWGFLARELAPTASYQRHITALKMIDSLFSSLSHVRHPWSEYDLDIDLIITSLLDLIMDPFDDVRELAASILNKSLQTFPRDITPSAQNTMSEMRMLRFSKSAGLNDALLLYDRPFWARVMHRAVSKMQSSGRADHADGFGRLYDICHGSHGLSSEDTALGGDPHFVLGNLVSDIEQCIASARSNLYLAVGTAPLHGYLIAARYLMLRYKSRGHAHPNNESQAQAWRDLIDQLLKTSVHVWEAVKGILCADAPEGYEIGSANEFTVGTKDLLSYCWRALKESSTLMHAMIVGAKPTPISQAFQYSHYRAFGELVFEQLAELRHRGAFSTVSQTFAECCLRCAQSDDPRTQALPKEWYQKTLLCIQQRGSALTRRSAGLPAMITSILTAYPEGEFFDSVILDLHAVADKGADTADFDKSLRLPQVHGFNCLKDIFTETKFGDSVEGHMSISLEIAVRGLESDQWAIRNCGLMLLKALITRMNDGTNTASSKVSSSHRRLSTLVYDKFQNVPDLLLRLLNHDDTLTQESPLAQSRAALPHNSVLQAQQVFSALEIIEQSGIPKRHESEIWRAVWSHVEGPVWAIREKAAKALSHLPVSNDIEQEVQRCLQDTWSTQNALHGRHLYLRFLFARIDSTQAETAVNVFAYVLEQFPNMILSNCCPITRASYMSLVAQILEAGAGEDKIWKRMSINVKEAQPSYSPPNLWQEFMQYLFQPCPEDPAFALETAMKLRCRVLLDFQGKEICLPIDSSQSIFASHGSLEDPETSKHILRQTGTFLAHPTTVVDQSMDTNDRDLQCWVKALKLAQDENADVTTRQAAIDSLANFFEAVKDLPAPAKTSPVMLELYLLIYDSLLDDEEDVRDSGATVASMLLDSATSQDTKDGLPISLMVPAARNKLLQFCQHTYHNSLFLWTQSLKRLLGFHSIPSVHARNDLLHWPSPKALLQDTNREDTALFVEEKQNLYIDDAQEARVWQGVLLSMHRNAINADDLENFHAWALEGVDALIEVAGGEIDGPLGWTSKPDVFTLGVRILLAAEAVLRFSSSSAADGRGGGEEGVVLRGRVEELFELGRRCELRPAWMRMLRDMVGEKDAGA
ncbi:MAG: hypothetical protein LQ344_006595 [Seirophora lacunosa]|nr:MAG: hypothetical protein LQ344_006595 [Seirophora lacunosa]